MSQRCPGTDINTEFTPFPSKGNRAKDANNDGERRYDPAVECDDGDQTSYNGILCASGNEEGCKAVADLQGTSGVDRGRWFRSPHRKWMWTHRCFDRKHPLSKKDFIADCANSFSPDMGLGVMLYTLAKQDTARYRLWLNWLDQNAGTTELCKLNADNEKTDDCIKVEWPRVCDHDLGFSKDPGIAVFGRYGGQCVLRPPDALDFAAVNDATGTASPARINLFEVELRLIMKKLLIEADPTHSLLGSIPPLILLSSFDPKHYPLHLDADRVLIRMMIRNPSLQLNNLPDMPDPNDLMNNMFVLKIVRWHRSPVDQHGREDYCCTRRLEPIFSIACPWSNVCGEGSHHRTLPKCERRQKHSSNRLAMGEDGQSRQ